MMVVLALRLVPPVLRPLPRLTLLLLLLLVVVVAVVVALRLVPAELRPVPRLALLLLLSGRGLDRVLQAGGGVQHVAVAVAHVALGREHVLALALLEPAQLFALVEGAVGRSGVRLVGGRVAVAGLRRLLLLLVEAAALSPGSERLPHEAVVPVVLELFLVRRARPVPRGLLLLVLGLALVLSLLLVPALAHY